MKALKNTLNFRGSGESRYDLKKDELWQSSRDKAVSACRCAVGTQLTWREKTKAGIGATMQYSSSWTNQFLKNRYMTHLHYTFLTSIPDHLSCFWILFWIQITADSTTCHKGRSKTFPNDVGHFDAASSVAEVASSVISLFQCYCCSIIN